MSRWIALGCGTMLWLAAGHLAAGNGPAAPVHTNKNKFRIPFKFDPAEMKALGAREVRLYVSRDRGGTWQQTQSVPPDSAKFQFQAPGEGEYWFIVRTLDSQNRLHPDTPTMEPGLMVVVDATPPQLKLELRQPSPGRVQLAWAATDNHLDVSQLRIEYIQPGQPEWQTVGIVPRAVGQTEWSVPEAGIVAVRGTIGDHAKNTHSAETQLRVSSAPEGQRSSSPASRHPVATPSPLSVPSPTPDVAQTWPALPSEPETIDPPTIRERSPVFAQPVSRGTSLSGPLPSDTPSLESFSSALERERALEPEPTLTPPALGAPGFSQTAIPEPAPEKSGIEGQPWSPSISSDRNPERGGWGETHRKTRYINSKKFQLGYSIQDVGPSGVGAVEIYATDTDGRRWFRYGEDGDCQSPAIVEVPGEGRYGFSLCVRSGAGLASDPPVNGTQPPIVVQVDQTAPKIELIGVEQGRGNSAGKIVVTYRYHDAHPAEKPVQLSFSATGSEPWQPIQGWQENTGRYVWTVGSNSPGRVYLRVEARDAAGNKTISSTGEPILIDLSRPTARIIDIEAQSFGEGPGL